MTPNKKRVKPLKRPVQERSKFTVDAIYGGFVRIWRAGGWTQVTTRAVALEAGVSIGTLYEYFPNKEALLSGYVRHCIEALIAAIDAQVVAAKDVDWRMRLKKLVRLTCGVDDCVLPYFDGAMLLRENEFAEPKHHVRAFEELAGAWRRAFAACSDLSHTLSIERIHSLFIAVWGGRRYLLMLGQGGMEEWASQMEVLCCAAIVEMDGEPG